MRVVVSHFWSERLSTRHIHLLVSMSTSWQLSKTVEKSIPFSLTPLSNPSNRLAAWATRMEPFIRVLQFLVMKFCNGGQKIPRKFVAPNIHQCITVFWPRNCFVLYHSLILIILKTMLENMVYVICQRLINGRSQLLMPFSLP